MKDVIKQLSELYIIQRGHYLIQYPFGYKQYTKGSKDAKGNKVKPLMDWQFEKHLEGIMTVGTFSKFFSKFMTFDVDFHDAYQAKWVTYKISYVLYNLGINEHYISFSGNKGYHIDIFFEDLISIEQAKKFFDFVINYAELTNIFDAGNKVEFRVTDKLGVKLPLGKHQFSGNYCGFCKVEDGLKVMTETGSHEYLFTIKKIQRKQVLDILDMEDEIDFDSDTIIKTEKAISSYVAPENHTQSEDYSISRAIDLLQNGLKVQGSRHNSILLIGMYLKYSGLEEEECNVELHSWMDQQKTENYSSSLEECHKDIDQVVKDIYERNYNLAATNKDLTVSLSEIKWIMDNCPDKNQKLIAYAMLIHSKRHANMQGVFYFTFNSIASATGITEKTVRTQVNKLIEFGVIEAERNRKVKGKVSNGKCNLPNLYRINFDVPVDSSTDTFVTNSGKDFSQCLKYYFSDKELKKMLPRRQYESIIA
ncbi:hypothetical protein JNUCC31_04280 [Paenibacillus sp. JNUCC31]|uniref:TOTE conflict system archaeo-eukaryotic primase domain-containing protein n=1 Tax=Paenibacillus sp. JNUCC-31 TaxID=2777983 RepID=UPI001783B747|nr:hypothetical protein [Paenibacillus sp. JNUCC-31]QOS80164.1 hypothetical protein JNUCC31_04280 [Paenibacillus sp. JNUCC-31]